MRKRFIIGVASAAMLLLSACGETNIGENVSEARAPKEASNTASAETSQAASTEASVEPVSNEASTQAGTELSNDVAAMPEDLMDEASKKLYQDFFDGKEKAVFDASEEFHKCFPYYYDLLKDKESYTLDDLIDLVKDNAHLERGTKKYIDCALDGKLELLVSLVFEDSRGYDFIVKDKGGELKICYLSDSAERDYSIVNYSGETERYMNSGDMHGSEHGFIDGEGDYHFWYVDCESEAGYGNARIGNLPELDGVAYVSEEMLSFKKEHEKADEYYYFIMDDKDYNTIEEDPSSDNNPYETVRKAYKDAGYNIISKDEFDKMVADARKKIGYTDEVYNLNCEGSRELYEAFLDDKEKAEFDASSDTGEHVKFSEFLTDKESYTLREIFEKFDDWNKKHDDWEREGYIKNYTDVGLDGKAELIITMNVYCEYKPYIVVKNVDGKLKICAVGD